MRLSTMLCVLLVCAPAAHAIVPVGTTPAIFAPGSIAGDADDGSDIFIAFATPGGWSTPVDLGLAGTESRLAPDLATLYFSGADRHVQSFALGSWLARHAESRQ